MDFHDLADSVESLGAVALTLLILASVHCALITESSDLP